MNDGSGGTSKGLGNRIALVLEPVNKSWNHNTALNTAICHTTTGSTWLVIIVMARSVCDRSGSEHILG